MALGAELEEFGTKEAMADDQKVADVYTKKGAKVADLDEATVEQWRAHRASDRLEGLRRQDRAVGRTAQTRRGRPRLLNPSRVCRDGHGLDERRDQSPWRRRPAPPAFADRHPRIASIRRSCCLSSIALVVAAFVLTYSVVSRYFFHFSTDWQDELSVFLIVGAVFMSSAAIQARRGHVGIEAIVGPAARRVNRIRCSWSTSRACVLQLFRVEVVDAAGGGLGRGLPFRLDLGAAALDSLFADDGRHDAAQHPDCCCRSIGELRAGRTARHERALDRAALRRLHTARDVCRNADRVCARRGGDLVHDRVHAGIARSIPSPRTSMRRWRRSRCCRSRCSSSRAPPSGARAPARISTARCMPGCIAFPAGLASPMCSPARCLPRWPAPRPRPARPSARPAFRKCASAAIPAALRPGSSRPAARSAFCCRPRSR